MNTTTESGTAKRHPVAVAWDEWLASDEGQSCRAANTLTGNSMYLENRLWRAFTAGAKSAPADTEQLVRLRDWKESAMAILAEYDAVAETFGGKLGSSKMKNLERGIERLRQAAGVADEALQLIQGFDWLLDDSAHGEEIRRRAIAAINELRAQLAAAERELTNLRADTAHLNERLGIQEGHCKRLQGELGRAVREVK